MDDFQKANASFARIRETPPDQERSSRMVWAPHFRVVRWQWSFDHVSFGYGEEEMVVQDLTFKVEPGKVLGLLGRTGSGKTTLTRLLFACTIRRRGRFAWGRRICARRGSRICAR